MSESSKSLGLAGRLSRFDNPARGRYGQSSYYGPTLDSLFPALPPAASDKPVKPTVEPWPAEARALVESLLRRDKLSAVKGGIEINSTTQSFDTRLKRLSNESQELDLVSARAWVVRNQGDTSPRMIQWCDAKLRGVYSTVMQLGRQRPAADSDLKNAPVGLSDYSLASLELSYPAYRPEIEKQGDDRAMLKLTHPNSPGQQLRWLIDTKRHVVLRYEYVSEGKVSSVTTFSDFVEVAGSWWAKSVETVDERAPHEPGQVGSERDRRRGVR